MDNYIVLDLETTGFSPQTNEIIEIGAWKIKDDVVVAKFQTYIKPHSYISRSVQELTGITMDKLNTAPSIEEILPAFIDWCESLPFLGHNLSFDYSFLSVKSKNLGLDITLNGKRVGIDTLKIARKFYFNRFENNELKTLADGFGIRINGNGISWHSAIYDSYITKLLYDCMKNEFPLVSLVQTPELIVKNSSEYGKVVNEDALSFTD